MQTEIPVRVEYSLTKRTTELESILKQLSNWVNKWKYYENNKNKIMSATTDTAT